MSKSYPYVIGLIVFLLIVATISFVVFYSPDKISEVKNEENIGKTVSVKGEVKNVIKIGGLSGYTLEDETGSIAVSSNELPEEGESKSVRGTLIRDTLFGYYIKVD